MVALAVLLALALPLGLGASQDEGVRVEVDGVAGLRVDDGAHVDVPVASVRVDASRDGVAVAAPVVGEAAIAVPSSGRAASHEAAHEPAPASASWVPSPGPAAAAAGSFIGLGVIGLGLAHLAGLLPWVPSFSRIEDADLAKHPARRLALDFVAANPGATLQEVRHGLGLAWGTTVHHLGRLERAGLVAVRRVGGRRCHFPLGQAPPRDALPAPGQALARLVREAPGLGQSELARRAGLLAPAASKHLARLQAAGLVTAVRVGRAVQYAPTERLTAAVA